MSNEYNPDDDFHCFRCGKYLFTEIEAPTDTGLKCVKGSYDNCYYDGVKDIFFCIDCAKKLGYNTEDT